MIQTDFREAFKNNWVIVFISVYLLATCVWYLLTDSPWDDDCVTRYFHTKKAFSEPAEFVKTWNRPLFVLLFAIPFQISKHTILLMAALSAFSALCLYRTLEKQSIKNAYLVIPLFLFQAYFFTISRSSLAEPLAAAIFSIAYYMYHEKKFLMFTILGSLIPLARLELSVLLPIWVFLLIKNKVWKYIPILGIPILLWSFFGYILQDDALYLYNKTLGNPNKVNRYGHKTFFHYFRRYIYFLGPTVFYFLAIGVAERLYKRKASIFIMLQFVCGFFLYVVFSWKLSLGQAAGFLRHLAVLSPFAAILALHGYNYFIDYATREKIEPEIEEKKVKWKQKKKDKKAKKMDSPKKARIRIGLYSIILLASVFFYMSVEIESHHTLTEVKDYSRLLIILVFASLFVVLIYFKERIKILHLNLLVGFSVIGFTLITEPPNSHHSPERRTMTDITNYISQAYLNKYDYYANHNWFYWASGEVYGEKNALNRLNLINAKDSSIVIWESHYSDKHNGDVKENVLIDDPNYVCLYRKLSEDKKFLVAVYQLIKNSKPIEKVKAIDQFLSIAIDDPDAYFTRGVYYLSVLGDKKASIYDFNKAIELDSNYRDAYFNKGVASANMNLYNESIMAFKKCLTFNPEDHEAYFNIGVNYSNARELDSALAYYNKTVEIKNDYVMGYLGRGSIYEKKKQYKDGLVNFLKALELDPNEPKAYYNSGVMYLYLNNREEACKYLNKSYNLGFKSAQNVIQNYCK